MTKKSRQTSVLFLIFFVGFTTFYRVFLTSDGTVAMSLATFEEEQQNEIEGVDGKFTPQTYDLRNNATDYRKLIDMEFRFKIMNWMDCNKGFLLILVHSAPGNFEKRQAIRKSVNGKHEVSIMFALGAVTGNLTLQGKVYEEHRVHEDILQGSFEDTYEHLTYKHVMLFKYFLYHCPNNEFLLKIDDDTFINIEEIHTFLGELKRTNDFTFCIPNTVKIVRSFRSEYPKWRLSFSEYPHKKYPPSCVGFFIIYSKNVVEKLYNLAQENNYFWIDDLHVTGHLYKNLNIKHVDARPYFLHREKLREFMIDGTGNMKFNFLFAGPDLSGAEMNFLLSLFHRPSLIR